MALASSTAPKLADVAKSGETMPKMAHKASRTATGPHACKRRVAAEDRFAVLPAWGGRSRAALVTDSPPAEWGRQTVPRNRG